MILNLSKQQFLDLSLLIRLARQNIDRTEEGSIELKNSEKSLELKWNPDQIDITIG